MHTRTLLTLLLGSWLTACTGDTTETATEVPTETEVPTDTAADSCADVSIADSFPEAGTTGACTTAEGVQIANSMMNLDGITIDNLGEEMTPCIRVECDSDYAYIVSNNLPHYDFVQLTPNALVESVGVVRLPLFTTSPTDTDGADVRTMNGCDDAYDAYVADEGVLNPEPSGFCGDGYLSEQTDAGTVAYAQLGCLDQFAVMTSGVAANGPNEGDVGVWGDPGLEPANELAEGPGASVDYCGGHTGRSMHYHSVFEECFDIDEEQKPTMSYVSVGLNWSQLGQLTDTCTEPSGIVGWSLDGIPIKGPCICTERAADDSCATVKLARSSWLYRGFSSNAPEGEPVDDALATEGEACTERDDCCDTYPCDLTCNHVVTDGDDAGSAVNQVCTFTRYAWCTRDYVDELANEDVTAENFVYLDVCNAYDGADGLAYHTTGTFPYMQGCYVGEPAEQAAAGQDDRPSGPPPN